RPQRGARIEPRREGGSRRRGGPAVRRARRLRGATCGDRPGPRPPAPPRAVSDHVRHGLRCLGGLLAHGLPVRVRATPWRLGATHIRGGLRALRRSPDRRDHRRLRSQARAEADARSGVVLTSKEAEPALILVRNPATHDSRVLREAKTLSRLGYRPLIVAVVSTEEQAPHSIVDGVPILRLSPTSPFSWIRSRLNRLRRGRAVGG